MADIRQKNLETHNQLLQDIKHNGYSGIGKSEPLKDNLQDYWSRCIYETNRLIYRIVRWKAY